MTLKSCLYLTFVLHQLCESANILVYVPCPSISHQVVFRPYVQELLKRGHHVTTVTADPAFPKGQTPENFTEIEVHDLSYKKWDEFVNICTGKKAELSKQLQVGLRVLADIFLAQTETEQVKAIFKKKFDLLVIEAVVRPVLALSHIFKAPVIQMSSFGASFSNHEVIGSPVHPILYPGVFRQKLYNLTALETILEVYAYQKLTYKYENALENEDRMLRKRFGDDMPSLIELQNNVDMMFLNTHWIWDSNRPAPPGLIYLGGLHQTPVKELPEDLKTYLDSSQNGVIYISFGTNVIPSSLPEEKQRIFRNVLSQLPYDVLWKWDKDGMIGKPKNVRISKWLPQSDLLNHPKIKLFITQGGLQSTDESISAGVPLLGIPLLVDQWYNTEKYSYHKIGMKLEMETLNENELKSAVETVIGDESYRKNVARLRAVMADQPQSPLERAVWWTEHVLRHGGAAHLRAPAANMSWPEYLELNVILLLLAFVVSVLLLILSLVYCTVKICRGNGKTKRD